ncbi:MAG: Cna B-type domain-containing protein, partial [Clostridiaceae bacterium]|nr:Cna B-type domain-containing protein [Clostridiaceae bacterium]
NNGWTGTFDDLPLNKAVGTAIAYTVEEAVVPAGYARKITGSAASGYKITNSYAPSTTSVSVTKAWDDADNQDGLRPASITVQLYADGKAVKGKTLELSKANNWTGTFDGLPERKAGTAIAYTVEEAVVPAGYTRKITGSAASGYTITNSYAPVKAGVSVTKVWEDNDNRDGMRPASVTIQLYADGVAVPGKTLELGENNDWTGTFFDLPMNNAGTAIVYTVAETPEPAIYVPIVSGDAINGFVVTNIVPEILPATGDNGYVFPQTLIPVLLGILLLSLLLIVRRKKRFD